MKIRGNFLNLFVIISSFLSMLITFYNMNNIKNGYDFVVLFPCVFLIVFFVTIGKININKSAIPCTTYVFLILQWIRYILTPTMIAISGENCGTFFLNPNASSIYLATIIAIFDLTITFFALYYFAKKRKIIENTRKVLFRGNKYFYSIYIFFAILVYMYVEKDVNIFNFLFISTDTVERLGDITDTNILIARQIVLGAIVIIFLWSADFCANKYNLTKRKLYVYLSIMMALINVSIIVGERRSVQLYAAFSSIFILCKLYPKLKRHFFFIVGGTTIVILFFTSVYKFSSAFLYGSYMDALENTSFDFSWITRMLQSYFGGPQDFATVIDFAQKNNINMMNLLFDFLRSIVPISFFVKGMGTLTSQMFNSYIYSGSQETGHIISSVAYGYIYFGILFSSLFSVFNIAVSYYMEIKMNMSNSYEMMYLWGYVLMRFAFGMFMNTPALLSTTTIMLVTFGLIFKVASILKININKKN